LDEPYLSPKQLAALAESRKLPITEKAQRDLANGILWQAMDDLRLLLDGQDIETEERKYPEQKLDDLWQWFFGEDAGGYSFEMVAGLAGYKPEALRDKLDKRFRAASNEQALARLRCLVYRKLTRGQVLVIRRRRKQGASRMELSTEFGVDVSHISRICVGTRWHGVRGPRTRKMWNHQSPDRPD
jgi:hypothetical protein